MKRTEQVIREKAEREYLDACALTVCAKGRKRFVSTPGVDEDTLFDIASMGKVLVTSTLILIAAGKGLLGLDDPIGKFFPFAPADKRDVTIKQCLTHTSGMADNVFFAGSLAEVGAENIVRQIMVLPLRFAPGTKCMYSCAGMWTLGFIAEKAYGMPLEDAFKRYIASPLGYTRSRFNMAADEPNAAKCYTREKAGDFPCPWDDATVCLLGTSGGSGGQFFTSHDISLFCEAVLKRSGALYPEEYFRLAERPYARRDDDPTELRGLGYYVTDERHVQGGKLISAGSFGHNGWTGTRFYIDRKKDMYVVLLTNMTRFLNKRHGWRHDFDPREDFPTLIDIFNAAEADLREEGLL